MLTFWSKPESSVNTIRHWSPSRQYREGHLEQPQVRPLQMWGWALTCILSYLEPSVLESALTPTLQIPVCHTFTRSCSDQELRGETTPYLVVFCSSVFKVCRQANRDEKTVPWDCENSGAVMCRDTAAGLRNP